MIIPIQNNNDDETPTGNVQEWALIELNGELVPPLSSSEKPPQSQEPNENNILKDTVELGSIEMRKGKPIMVVGSHELEGKIETLKQPFAVLRKRRKKKIIHQNETTHITEDTNDNIDENNNLGDKRKRTASDDQMENGEMSYEIGGIISKRIMFKRYPKSILGPPSIHLRK